MLFSEETLSTANMVRMRLFLIESPVRMKRRQGVRSIVGSVKRVLIGFTDTDSEAAPDVLTEDVLDERLPRRDGAVVVPDGPGLGIDVSESAIRRNARIAAAL